MSVDEMGRPKGAVPVSEVDVNATLAANLARYRAARGLSLAKLAEASGVSRAMLNQIERSQSVPTIGVLWKIATALDVPFAALLEQPGGDTTTVLRGQRSWTLRSQDGAFESRALFPLSGPRQTEFYELRLAPGVREIAEPHAAGTFENIAVHEGCVEIDVDGTSYRLDAGDAIHFRADVPHAYHNPSRELTIAYLVMTYATRPTT